MNCTNFNSGILLELCDYINNTVEEIKFSKFNKIVLNTCLKILRINMLDCKTSSKTEILEYFNIQNENLFIMNPESQKYKYLKAFYCEIIKCLQKPITYYKDDGYESN